MNRAKQYGALAALGLLGLAPRAGAHISVTSGPAFADTNQEITFGVGHGCEGSDTLSVRVEIPTEVVSVRALGSDLGPASVALDDAGLVRAVTWAKPQASVLEADTHYYKLTFRIRVPNQPFTTLHFPTYQTCQASDGTTLEVGWVSTTEDESEESEPAPALRIVPKRLSGWNKLRVPQAMSDLSAFFSDAVIVWKGNAAYSANPSTADLIAATAGVSPLSALLANDEIWVRY